MTGIWKEPHASYPPKLKERKALESEIAALTGQTFVPRQGEEIFELSLDALYKELINMEG